MKTKILSIFNWRRLIALFTLAILILVSANHPTGAQTVTEGYNSDEQLQRGMLVTLTSDDNTKIKASTKDSAKDTFGVVVGASDSAVTLSKDGQQYFVATVGNYDVLVSDQNGKINKGDYITVSSIPGIAMKASDRDPIVIGKALADFDGKKDIVSTAKLKGSDSKEFEVSIARLLVQIKIAGNPTLKATEPELPDGLKRVTDAIAGKRISVFRGYVALVVFVLSAIAASSLLYGGVKSAIISVGRNPLSKKSITRSMLQVVASGLIIFITGLIGVYLILKL